jgi:amino acid transporter
MSSTSIRSGNDEDEKVNLKKSIILLSACALIVGTIVGSGIFITPREIQIGSGSFGVALLVWLLCGLIALIGAICYTELGTMIQTSGGDYAYINLSYGSLYSFLYIWMMVFLTIPSFNAVSARTVAEYLVKLFFSNCDDYENHATSVKVIGVCILCEIHWSIDRLGTTLLNTVFFSSVPGLC